MNQPREWNLNRRQALVASGTMAGGLLAETRVDGRSIESSVAEPFRYCLNMSTIRGQELTADQEVDVAGRAGYNAIEPWMNKLNAFVEQGGKPADLRKRIEGYGMSVESAIGFAPWIVNDEQRRTKGLEQARKEMDLLAQLGAKRIAAPPAGVPRGERVELAAAAERYHALLEIGDAIGVVPQVEMWGGNSSIGRVSEAIYVAIESGHPRACFLGDIYHTYKGGCDFDGLKLLGPQALQVFHVNDYPADPPRETIRDEHRVYPGDGIAPVTEILQGFLAVGATPALSLELFNRAYWQQDAAAVARTGLEKMKASVAAIQR